MTAVSPGWLLAVGVAGLAGVVLHEATHWLLWRASGRQPRVTLWPPTVYIPPEGYERVELRDRIAAGGPFGIGVLSGILALAAGLPVTGPVVAAWLGYSFPKRDLGVIFARA